MSRASREEPTILDGLVQQTVDFDASSVKITQKKMKSYKWSGKTEHLEAEPVAFFLQTTYEANFGTLEKIVVRDINGHKFAHIIESRIKINYVILI